MLQKRKKGYRKAEKKNTTVSYLQFVNTSLATLTTEPEVVDNVINPLFKWFTILNSCCLSRKA